MSQNILHFLLCLIRYIREESECCNVHEHISVKPSDITGKFFPPCSCTCRLEKILRDMETARKVVGRSCRDVTDRNLFFSLHHSGYDLIKCSVTTTADHTVILLCKCLYFIISVFIFLRRIYNHFISCFYNNVNNIRKLRF